MQRIREMSFQLNQIAYIMWYTSDSRENCVRTSMESVVMWGLSLPTSIKLNFHFVIIYGHKASHRSTVLLWLFPGKKGRHFSYCTWKRPWLCGLMNAYDVHFWPTSKLLRLKLMVLVSQPYILLVSSFCVGFASFTPSPHTSHGTRVYFWSNHLVWLTTTAHFTTTRKIQFQFGPQ